MLLSMAALAVRIDEQTLQLTIPGAPRTKKTSNRIIGLGKECALCGKQPVQRVIPSKAHENWFKAAMTYAPVIRAELGAEGFDLPIAGPVALAATFYRDRAIGDLSGYIQALQDWLQAPEYKLFCMAPECDYAGQGVFEKGAKCPTCGYIVGTKPKRSGAGILADDKQIVRLCFERPVAQGLRIVQRHEHCELAKSKDHPRIEAMVRIL